MHPMRDLIHRSHPSSPMSRMAVTKYRLFLCKSEEAGEFCPQFHITKRLLGRCAINTETSAEKSPAGATPAMKKFFIPCVAAVFVLFMRDAGFRANSVTR